MILGGLPGIMTARPGLIGVLHQGLSPRVGSLRGTWVGRMQHPLPGEAAVMMIFG
jgi:hypothetical protein